MKIKFEKFDIVMVDFGDNTIGSEQGGKRPAIIVQNDIGNHFAATTIVIPFSTKLKKINQPTHTLIKKGKRYRVGKRFYCFVRMHKKYFRIKNRKIPWKDNIYGR